MNHLESSAQEWDELYAERATIWSGQPNPQLVAEVTGMSPGRALDVGCGEGADAMWLASAGWRVTAIDISAIALDRARAHATSAGVDIDFEQRDVVRDPPPASSFDLVSAQFFQIVEPPRNAVLADLGEAVSPGGRLLVVGHDPSRHAGHGHDADHDRRMFGVNEVVALFTPPLWHVEVAERRDRRGMHRGEMTDMTDAVVLVRRAGR